MAREDASAGGRMQGRPVRDGEFAGLQARIAAVLRREGYYTRAQVMAWYRADPRHVGVIRGLGPASIALLAVWLGEPAKDRAR